MGLSGSGINEENHIVNGSWVAWLNDDSIGAILSVPFCPLPFCPRTRMCDVQLQGVWKKMQAQQEVGYWALWYDMALMIKLMPFT